MGFVTGRPVHATDTVAWLRSGIATLAHDHRLMIVDAGEADLTLSVHLLKAYVMNQNTAKSATVVVQAQYKTITQDVDRVYRGSDSGVNWFSGRGELEGALDSSLNDVLTQMDTDILTFCPVPTAPKA